MKAAVECSSFVVKSVQELIKEPISEVPQHFILDDPYPPPILPAAPLPLLHTIDMKLLIMSETADSELEKLHSTCTEWGFFQVNFSHYRLSLVTFLCIALQLVGYGERGVIK